MISGDQRCSFLSLNDLISINIVKYMNFLLTNPSSAQHSIKRILHTNINPPDEIYSTALYVSLDEFSLTRSD